MYTVIFDLLKLFKSKLMGVFSVCQSLKHGHTCLEIVESVYIERTNMSSYFVNRLYTSFFRKRFAQMIVKKLLHCQLFNNVYLIRCKI